MTTPSDKFEWEYLVRLNAGGYVVLPVWADNRDDAKAQALYEVIEAMPAWCTVEVEGVKKADPPSMRFFLRNIERMDEVDAQEFYYGTEGDDE